MPEERTFGIHGALMINVVGSDPVSDTICRTLDSFVAPGGDADLTLVMGALPGGGWEPEGDLVGDRYLYDSSSGITTVLGDRPSKNPARSQVEYVLTGDLRSPRGRLTVYVPKLRKRTGGWTNVKFELRRRNFRRALLAASGNPFGDRNVIRQAEMITEEIIEPFLFYRLPSKGLSLLHAASVSDGEQAVLVGGSANIGKTAFVLSSAKAGRGLLGDSYVIVSETGDVLSYPGLVKLNAGHLSIFPEVRHQLTRGMGSFGSSLLESELSSNPNGALGALPQWKFAELFEGATVRSRGTLKLTVLVRRKSGGEVRCEEILPETAARSLAAELYWDFESAGWRNNRFILAPSAARGNDLASEATELHSKVAGVVYKGVSRSRCFGVEVPLGVPIQQVEKLVPGLGGPLRSHT